MRHRLWPALVALGAAVTLLVSASATTSSAEGAQGGTLRLMLGAEPDSVDPALATGSRMSWALLFATCAKLFNTSYDSRRDELRVTPEVTKSFSLSNDGRTYTFRLRRTFRFDTGAPVTAQSFADAFNRDANPAMSSPARRFMDEIIGADAVIQGKTDVISGVRVLDRYRLQFRLKRRAGDFTARLTMPFFCPIPPDTPTEPIERPHGSGPYFVAERVPNRRMVLERNPHYGGARTANPDRIIWTIEPDADTRVRATEQNENDFTPLFSYPDAVVRALVAKYGINRPGGQLLQYPTLATELFVFNPDRPAFKAAAQIPLKKAINYAVDRSAVTRARGYLQGIPTDRLLPPSLVHSRPVYPVRRADPVTARKWLARAGRRPRTLVLYTANFAFGPKTGEVLASNLRQLGIDLSVKYFEFTTLLDKLRRPNEPWDLAWLPWGTWYADPAGFLVLFTRAGKFRGTPFEARVDAANRVTNARRSKAWADLEDNLMRTDPPVAAYMTASGVSLLSRSFGCFRRHPLYELDLAAACAK